MNLLYFHQHFSTPNGTTGIRSYEMSKRLIEQGHKVTVVCGSYLGGDTGLGSKFIRGKREGTVDGINIIEFDLAYKNSDNFFKRSIVFLIFSFKSLLILFRKEYDTIFSTSTPLTAAIPGIFGRWLLGKKFIFEVRDLWPELPKAMGVIKNPIYLIMLSALEKLAYVSANKCIGLSPGIVSGMIKKGVKSKNIILVPNGCDLSLFQNSNSWRPDSIRESDFLCVYSGTHGIANGLDSLLDVSLELQNQKINNIKILLVGDGMMKDSLQKKSSKLGLKNIIFHRPLPKKKLSELLAGSDLGLQILKDVPAFYYGTSPNKFFDYLSAGLPIICNYPGWISDIISNNNCGYVVNPDNALEFANILIHASNNVNKLRQMGINSRKLAEDTFDRNLLAEDWINWVTKENF